MITLGEIPVGGRLLVRSKKDWRFAVVCRKSEAGVSLAVASPTGCNYRLRRPADASIQFDGKIPFLASEVRDLWRDNFSCYDRRW